MYILGEIQPRIQSKGENFHESVIRERVAPCSCNSFHHFHFFCLRFSRKSESRNMGGNIFLVRCASCFRIWKEDVENKTFEKYN